ncbi:MAG: site-specific DNA-methyltransferase [Candidatus Marinimicrobia bacterium]|nr:site-specific DNA-methyltransferase [Candidatus Neomarinimicrobiota bacterium]
MSSKGTETSSFGVSQRENHDSSKFYKTALYDGLRIKKKNIKFTENKIENHYLNNILHKSSEKMEELPDSSVHLMVTSPPYNVGKQYDDNLTLESYLQLLQNVFTEVYRVLVPGGRACINVANLGRKPYIPLHASIIEIMAEIGFLMRGEIIWDKQIGGGTAWGSWKSPSNPVLRDQHEYILIFCKETMSRKNPEDRKSTISKDEFLEYTKSVWKMPPDSAKKVGHPAPFPIDLPYRCIQLYTFENEIILDPFMGAGTTALAALKTSRKYIGYDTKKDYIDLANKRIHAHTAQVEIGF